MWYKKLLLFVASVSVLSGVWASEQPSASQSETIRPSIRYFLGLNGEMVPISAEGLKWSGHLAEFMDDADLAQEENDAVNVVIPVDGFVKNKNISVGLLKIFTEYAEERFVVAKLQSDLLISLIILTDLLGAREMLDELAYELAARIKDKDYKEFVQGKGLIIEIMQRLPITVLDQVLVNKMSKELKSFIELPGHTGGITALAVLPNDKLASASSDKTIKIWDLKRLNKKPDTLIGHTDRIAALAVCTDAKEEKLASASWDKTIRIWDMQHPQNTPLILEGHTDKIYSLAAGSQGFLMSGSADKTLRAWRQENFAAYATHKKQPRVITEHNSETAALVAVADTFVSGSFDGKVRAWNVNDLIAYENGSKEPLVLGQHAKKILALTTIAAGRIVSASADGTMKVYDIQSVQQPLIEFKEDGVWALQSLGEQSLVLGIDDGTMRIENPRYPYQNTVVLKTHGIEKKTSKVSSQKDLFPYMINCLCQLPDGRLVSGGRDKVIRIWEFFKGLTFEQLIEKKAIRKLAGSEKNLTTILGTIKLQLQLDAQKKKREKEYKKLLS